MEEIKKRTRVTVTEMDKLIGTNLKLKRLMLGMTLDEMKLHIGVSRHQLEKYEKGINRISSGRLFTISEKLGVPINYFYGQIEETKILLYECKNIQSLVRAFCSIKSEETRKSMINLAKSMAKASKIVDFRI